jgi:aquaporin related protein
MVSHHHSAISTSSSFYLQLTLDPNYTFSAPKMSTDNRSISIKVTHVPTMNIQTTPTTLSNADPLKRLFRALFDKLPPSSRGHIVAGLGEFIGTIVFVFLAFSGVQVAFISSNKTTKGNIDTSVTSVTPQELLYVALAVGVSLAVTAWVFFRISGGLFNPAVCTTNGILHPVSRNEC